MLLEVLESDALISAVQEGSASAAAARGVHRVLILLGAGFEGDDAAKLTARTLICVEEEEDEEGKDEEEEEKGRGRGEEEETEEKEDRGLR